MKFSKETIIKRKLDEIEKLIREDVLEIKTLRTRSAVYLGYDGYGSVSEDGFMSVGDLWECRDDFTRWFSADLIVPEGFAGKPLALDLEVGGEGIVRVNGAIVSAITSYLEPNGATRTRVMLSNSARAGERYAFEVEAHLNYMEFNRFRKLGHESIRYTIRTAALITINQVAESYWFDIATALDGMRVLQNPLDKVTKGPARLPNELLELFESVSKDTFAYEKVTDAVVSSLTLVDFDLGREALLSSLPKAAQVFRKKMDGILPDFHGLIKFVGQAHIDTAWLWPIRESIRKSAKTLSNVCALMDAYPEFTFAFSQPQLFLFCKERYPELYERVKEKVRSGQFELVGNTWVEMDTNIPSGESLVRQILYGRQFFLKEFGKCSDVFWMPDVFGYSWALPQIIKRSGMKYFFTSKLINNDDTRFPHSLFQWQGVDGTRIPAYLQRLNYNGKVCAETLDTLYRRYDQKAILDEALMTFGYGDGGGGPSYQMLETARRLKNFPGLPKLQMATSVSYFEDAKEVLDELPVWNDEMYYEFHRGTYTSQADVKKNNRKAELLYRQAEIASVLAHKEAGTAYPYNAFLSGYQKLLTNQFHDIMPGSSIHSVYEDTRESYEEIRSTGDEILTGGVWALAEHIKHPDNSYAVFNFLSWERGGVVRVDLKETPFAGSPSVSVRDAGGNPLKSVVREGALEFMAENVPSMGYAIYTLEKGEEAACETVRVALNEMENRFYRITLDTDYNLTSIWDKRNNREALSGTSNLLKVFEDKPGGETAWNIDVEYQNKEWPLKAALSAQVLRADAVKGVLRVTREFHKSRFCQDIVLYGDSDRIDFETYADWHETEKMLKAEFTADVLASKAAYEIQFGAIERPTHENTCYDRTKFEVCGHKWADLSEGNYGVSLLNDCKYGYDIRGNRMRITLLRSPIDPDPTADRGEHTFTYSLRPHAGGWVAANTVAAGYELNVPLYPLVLHGENQKGELPMEKSYVWGLPNNVILDTVKRAEDGSGTILRFYEASGTKTAAFVQSALCFQSVFECNLVETVERAVETEAGGFSFVMKPFEIKTFLLTAFPHESANPQSHSQVEML